MEAIKDALRALRKRHLLEEGAHGPAISALSKPMISQVPSPLIQFFSNSTFRLELCIGLSNCNNCF